MNQVSLVAGMDVKGVAAAVQEDVNTLVVPQVGSSCWGYIPKKNGLKEHCVLACRWGCKNDGVCTKRECPNPCVPGLCLLEHIYNQKIKCIGLTNPLKQN